MQRTLSRDVGSGLEVWSGSVTGSTLVLATCMNFEEPRKVTRRSFETPEAARAELAAQVAALEADGWLLDEFQCFDVERFGDGRYPFLFYGRRPQDWSEGHEYELLFMRVPHESERRQLASLFEKDLENGPVEPEPDPWEWAGRAVVLRVAERGNGNPVDVFFEGMASWLGNVNALVALQQVEMRNRRGDGNHPWDAWSLQHSPQPQRADAGTPAPDPKFEAARAKARRRR
jgi:hypothetical protein